MAIRLPLLALLFAAAPAFALDTCGGLPGLAVTTAPGFCVGIVADKLKFPRGVLPLPNGDLLVTDMVAWKAGVGKVWLFKRDGARYTKSELFNGLDRPHGIAMGPDGLVYVGTVQRIFRFDLKNPAGSATDVIGGTSSTPPLPGLGRHALNQFIFDADHNLIVNVGSATDHCEGSDGAAPVAKQPCAEGEGDNGLGLIRKYTMQWPAGTVKSWEVFARGLRNSMALAVHPATGELWQADNGRDFINLAIPSLKNDNELPHDELNLIKRGGHYGWPYCYDDNVVSPEYPSGSCTGYKAPVRLLPAHAAPLGMLFYTGSAFPAAYRNSLVIGFHGYRQNGHRIVALMPDKQGAPLGKMVELISEWRTGAKSTGAPVDIKLGADGAIYMADDRNGKVLRLQYTAP